MTSKMKREVNLLAREIYIRTMAIGINYEGGVKPTQAAELSFKSALCFLKVQEGVTYNANNN